MSVLFNLVVCYAKKACCEVDPQPTNYLKGVFTIGKIVQGGDGDSSLFFPHFLFSNGSNPFYGVSPICSYGNLQNYSFPSKDGFLYDYSCQINEPNTMSTMFNKSIVIIPNLSCPQCNCTIEKPPNGQNLQSVSLVVNTKRLTTGNTIYQYLFTGCSVTAKYSPAPYEETASFGQFLTMSLGRMRIKPSTLLLSSQVLLSAFFILM
ncbi:hypothetical protein PPL_05428 [Heterostelium album PN500]|uniref:Uncharacterized protein n=1 Tax=Heterostelium pallidum (strain ATCC 26659 / Pp 5 / PN500) TaxID=670386 RepID=D3BA53_HETP5|nr:hypothetical protein PPL_05428 [Heterostelium album PN500]EFA81440.1 hypothetical protein PPL_05428 [Heterostelium album PN500]|eukprot:XP_020433558.1 hypothetical protein PPL_05428 [Heterostelium album PN500]